VHKEGVGGDQGFPLADPQPWTLFGTIVRTHAPVGTRWSQFDFLEWLLLPILRPLLSTVRGK